MNNDYKYWLNKMCRICSTSEKSTNDILDKLKNSDLTDAETDEIIKYLIHNNFINHKRYASAFVSDKFKFNKWGKLKIKMALKQKGIE